MAAKHKASTKAEAPNSSPRKKAKVTKSSNSSEAQSGLGSFLKTPIKKPNKSNGPDNGVISLLSDSEPGDDGDIEHVPVASSSKAGKRPGDSEVIDLEGVLSSDSDDEDIKPIAGPSSLKNGSNASVHPMFRKGAVKVEDGVADGQNGVASIDRSVKEEEDVKPKVNNKGKGKADPSTSDSPKKLIFPKIESNEPIVYPLDKDIFEFDPKKDISTETWPRTQNGKLHTPYSFLVAAFVLISATRSRLIIVTVMTNTLRTIVEYDPEALKDAVYLVGRCAFKIIFQ